MYSMTGFGKGTFALDGRELTVELKSVNNRFLDISMRLPRVLSPLEDTFRHALQDRLSRGTDKESTEHPMKRCEHCSIFLMDIQC